LRRQARYITVDLGVLGVIGRIPVASVLTATKDLARRRFLSVNLGVVSVIGRLPVDSDLIATKEFGNPRLGGRYPARRRPDVRLRQPPSARNDAP
jgi:hypothetical protein